MITVKQLIDILSKMPKTYKVEIQNYSDHMIFDLQDVINNGKEFKTVTLFGCDDEDLQYW